MNNLVEKEWLEKNIFSSQLDERKLKHIFYFPILWNIFEKKLCHNNAQIRKYKKISQSIYNNKINMTNISEIYNYFKDRYVKDENHFLKLNFRDNNNTEQNIKQEITERFKKSEIANIEKIEVILCIAFRIRNNLFHGIKEVKKLYEQNENFKQINQFLIYILSNK